MTPPPPCNGRQLRAWHASKPRNYVPCIFKFLARNHSNENQAHALKSPARKIKKKNAPIRALVPSPESTGQAAPPNLFQAIKRDDKKKKKKDSEKRRKIKIRTKFWQLNWHNDGVSDAAGGGLCVGRASGWGWGLGVGVGVGLSGHCHCLAWPHLPLLLFSYFFFPSWSPSSLILSTQMQNNYFTFSLVFPLTPPPSHQPPHPTLWRITLSGQRLSKFMYFCLRLAISFFIFRFVFLLFFFCIEKHFKIQRQLSCSIHIFGSIYT